MEIVKLTRDCPASQVPSGMKMTLPAGMQVRITQSLGGSFTVVTEDGYMVRVAAEDADALGKAGAVHAPSPPSSSGSNEPLTQEFIEKKVWGELRTCFDPEIPVNIADLGLIYHCQVVPIAEGEFKVEIKMTLTAPGCGMGDVLRADVQGKILRIPGVKQTDVQLVWDPPWDHTRMTEAARLQLGIF